MQPLRVLLRPYSLEHTIIVPQVGKMEFGILCPFAFIAGIRVFYGEGMPVNDPARAGQSRNRRSLRFFFALLPVTFFQRSFSTQLALWLLFSSEYRASLESLK